MLDYKSLWYTTCHLLKMTEYPVFGMDPRKTHPLGPWQHHLKLVLYIENNTVQCIYVWYITIQYIIVQYNILPSAISLLLGNKFVIESFHICFHILYFHFQYLSRNKFCFCKYVLEVSKGSGRIGEIVYMCLGISGT